MRSRIHTMRERFAEMLTRKGVKGDFSFIKRQNGMFSFSGLSQQQVDRLRADHAIYVVSSGRINVAGMTDGNLDRLTDAIIAVQ